MSVKWLYITIVVILVSWMRYKGYQRSVRLEKKLDAVLKSLGVEMDEGAPENVGLPEDGRKKRFRLIKNPRPAQDPPGRSGSAKE
ncbi:MAG: hypothetical protein ACNS63_03795 [Candidatus Nitrospinota bacterium M3_3B_026]